MEITPKFNVGAALPAAPAKGGQAAAVPSAKVSDIPLPVSLHKAAEPSADALEAKRYETVVKASRALTNRYVVSDKTFTIFKDATGQYVTRFTNLRDGKVTYIPEPHLVRQLEQSSREAVQALAINV